MPVPKLKDYLDQNKVRYESILHSPAYTAPEVAQSAHVPGRELAKIVMLKLDGRMAMAVLPAADHVDLSSVSRVIGAMAQLATENEFKALFPDCEVGSMPAFGNLYGMEVFVTPRLAADEQIAFNAGSHTELVRMSYRDFERLAHPKVFDFALHPEQPAHR